MLGWCSENIVQEVYFSGKKNILLQCTIAVPSLTDRKGRNLGGRGAPRAGKRQGGPLSVHCSPLPVGPQGGGWATYPKVVSI